MRIALCADEVYSLPLAVAVGSILDVASDPTKVEIIVIDCGIHRESRKMLSDAWAPHGDRVKFVKPAVQSWLSLADPARTWISAATYARLLLPEILPDSWRRVIYIDTDTLTLSDLGELWELDLGDLPLAAIHDCGIPFVGSRGGIQNWPDYHLDPAAKYFNAGVMLLNLDLIRAQGTFESAWSYCASSAGLAAWADQEGLNAAVGGQFLELPQSWNAMWYWTRDDLPLDEGERLMQAVQIRHYSGPEKPWLDPRLNKMPWGWKAYRCALNKIQGNP
ncbi:MULTISPECIES: glycosyltransferase family 8 protein [Arthrobacter]|nr:MULTISPECIES: glycosyltransferase family 8 protein [Arthrobacter]